MLHAWVLGNFEFHIQIIDILYVFLSCDKKEYDTCHMKVL